MASMREYWANEAAAMRDTSGVLGKEVLKPVSNNYSAPKEDLSKVKVEGMTTDELEKWITALPSEKQRNIFNVMNKHANLSFNFSSKEELTIHLKIREAIIKRIIQVENAFDSNGDNPIALYPEGRDRLKLPEKYWLPIPYGGFIRNDNVDTASAIESLLQDGSNKGQNPSRLVIDCNRMLVVVAYVGLLDVLEKNVINKIFASNRKIVVGTWHESYDGYGNISLLSNKYFREEKMYSSTFTSACIDLCVPGDVVYFKNDLSYKSLLQEIRAYLSNDSNSVDDRNALLGDDRFTQAWTGEYCICTGQDKFSGFGLRERQNSNVEFSSDKIRSTLLKAATDLYELAKDKAKPIRDKIKNLNIPPPSMGNVTLDDRCYRINTGEIIRKR